MLLVDRQRLAFRMSGSLAWGIVRVLICREDKNTVCVCVCARVRVRVVLLTACRLYVTSWLFVRCSQLFLYIQFLENVYGPSLWASFILFYFFDYFTSGSGFLSVFCVISSSTCFSSSLWKFCDSPHKLSFRFHSHFNPNKFRLPLNDYLFQMWWMWAAILQVTVLQCKVFPVVTFFNEISESTLHFKCSIGNTVNVRTNINLQGVSLAHVLLLLFISFDLEKRCNWVKSGTELRTSLIRPE